MSWIIRSSTTFTSVPRSRNGARRWASMKRGSPSVPLSARIAALKRSRWPTCRFATRLPAMAMSSRACAGVSSWVSRPARAGRARALAGDRVMELRRGRYAHGVDLAEDLAVVDDRAASDLGGHRVTRLGTKRPRPRPAWNPAGPRTSGHGIDRDIPRRITAVRTVCMSGDDTQSRPCGSRGLPSASRRCKPSVTRPGCWRHWCSLRWCCPSSCTTPAH